MKRPLSPHLSIYRPQISSVLSIAHRLSGLGLVFASPLFLWALAAAAMGAESYQDFLTVVVGATWMKLLVSAAAIGFCYHLFNGIRHLIWDLGLGLAPPIANVSGWAVVVATLAASFLLLGRLWGLG